MDALVGWIVVAALAAAPQQGSTPQPQPQAATQRQPTPMPAFGEVLPEIKAAAWIPGDQQVSLASLRGQFVVLEFWKTDCQFCRRSMSIMEELKSKYGRRVAVLALTREDPEKVSAYLAEHPVGYPIGVASVTPPEWEVDKVPLVYLADPQGRLIYVCKPQQVEPVLGEALAGKPPLCTIPEQVAKYEAQLTTLAERAARGDTVRVWADAFGIRKKFPIKHPVYSQAKDLMIAQVKVGKRKLSQARKLAAESKTDQARELLRNVIRDYEGALLEKEAEKLLRSLDTPS